jgi:hypothetical protein
MSSKEIGGIVAALVYLGLIAALFYGWVANIIAIAHANFTEITGTLVLRVVGIFVAPLGSVMGFL